MYDVAKVADKKSFGTKVKKPHYFRINCDKSGK